MTRAAHQHHAAAEHAVSNPEMMVSWFSQIPSFFLAVILTNAFDRGGQCLVPCFETLDVRLATEL